MRTHTRRKRLTRPGVQHLWGFDNGHLATAVPDDSAQNRWELTVLNAYRVTSSSVGNAATVIGSLKPIEVRQFLRDIEARR